MGSWSPRFCLRYGCAFCWAPGHQSDQSKPTHEVERNSSLTESSGALWPSHSSSSTMLPLAGMSPHLYSWFMSRIADNPVVHGAWCPGSIKPKSTLSPCARAVLLLPQLRIGFSASCAPSSRPPASRILVIASTSSSQPSTSCSCPSFISYTRKLCRERLRIWTRILILTARTKLSFPSVIRSRSKGVGRLSWWRRRGRESRWGRGRWKPRGIPLMLREQALICRGFCVGAMCVCSYLPLWAFSYRTYLLT